jgi:hypothetical protein
VVRDVPGVLGVAECHAASAKRWPGSRAAPIAAFWGGRRGDPLAHADVPSASTESGGTWPGETDGCHHCEHRSHRDDAEDQKRPGGGEPRVLSPDREVPPPELVRRPTPRPTKRDGDDITLHAGWAMIGGLLGPDPVVEERRGHGRKCDEGDERHSEKPCDSEPGTPRYNVGHRVKLEHTSAHTEAVPSHRWPHLDVPSGRFAPVPGQPGAGVLGQVMSGLL